METYNMPRTQKHHIMLAQEAFILLKMWSKFEVVLQFHLVFISTYFHRIFLFGQSQVSIDLVFCHFFLSFC